MSRAAQPVRTANELRAANRRRDEIVCAADFLRHGEPHDDCIFPARGLPKCSRDYDPGPPPDDEKMYADSDLGALWGLNTRRAFTLAGWNVTTRRKTA